jgi:hypothetical protein
MNAKCQMSGKKALSPLQAIENEIKKSKGCTTFINYQIFFRFDLEIV